MSEIVTALAACRGPSPCDSPPSGTSDMALLSKTASLVTPIFEAPGSNEGQRSAVRTPTGELSGLQALTYRNAYRYISGNFRCVTRFTVSVTSALATTSPGGSVEVRQDGGCGLRRLRFDPRVVRACRVRRPRRGAEQGDAAQGGPSRPEDRHGGGRRRPPPEPGQVGVHPPAAGRLQLR